VHKPADPDQDGAHSIKPHAVAKHSQTYANLIEPGTVATYGAQNHSTYNK
jgi:hypothetical protein